MDGVILANSLVSLRGTDLRMVYALLCRTNIVDLLSSKTRDVFSKDNGDHFTKHLEAEVKKLENIDDRVIQVELFLEITSLLKLRGMKYTLEKEIVDQCTNVVRDVYQHYKKQDKQFRAFSEKQTNSTMLQQMIQFQMSKVFNELDESFNDFSIEDQTKFAEQVNDYIHSLPEEKQQKIKEKLGLNDLSDEMVRKTIAASGTSVVFAIIVEVSGFAFYTTATTLVASFAGLFGLTLPFGFYTGLTSTVAVLANPLFIIPMLLGGGYLLYNHQNKSLKSKLLPIIIMQISLPYMSNGGESVSFHPFLQEWEGRYENDVELREELEKIAREQDFVRKQISDCEKQIKDLNARVMSEEGVLESEKQRIKSALKFADLRQLKVSEPFSKRRQLYLKTLEDISYIMRSKKISNSSTGFFQRIGNSLSNFSSSLDIKGKEKIADSYLDLMVEDVLDSQSSFKENERNAVLSSRRILQELLRKKADEDMQKAELQEELSRLNSENSRFSKKIKTLEKENYGLADLFTKI
ncbi:hypothetical protein [Mesobacillus sp. S13]|uniref:hypothetical protein n=1 Tax=Mesobacillus sp. S13 TaxID=2880221 RepID=UPI001CF29290|nr:hypothetical protein [Mesobacillus sp. S13]